MWLCVTLVWPRVSDTFLLLLLSERKMWKLRIKPDLQLCAFFSGLKSSSCSKWCWLRNRWTDIDNYLWLCCCSQQHKNDLFIFSRGKNHLLINYPAHSSLWFCNWTTHGWIFTKLDVNITWEVIYRLLTFGADPLGWLHQRAQWKQHFMLDTVKSLQMF